MNSSPLVPALWNLLHDGHVESIVGSVPGEIRLGISIGYLRELFDDPGERFDLILHECTEFSFQELEGEAGAALPRELAAYATPADFPSLQEWGLEILSAEESGKIHCFISRGIYGTLSVSAQGFSLLLDSGREITLGELDEAAVAYWARFGRESRGPSPGPEREIADSE